MNHERSYAHDFDVADLLTCLGSHHDVTLQTEADGCFWITCRTCKVRGPRSNSIRKAILRAIIGGLAQELRSPRLGDPPGTRRQAG